MLFDAIYIEEETAEQLNDVHSTENATMIEQLHKTLEKCAAPSIFEDSTLIQVGVSLQQFENVESRTWSINQGAPSVRSDEDQEEVMDSYISPYSVQGGYERSKSEVARSARTQGEVLFGDTESVDEWMNPFPVSGVAEESTDGPMTPPPILQLERNQLDVSLESTDGKMTPTRGELMETAEIYDGNGELDTVEEHLRQTTESSEEEHLQSTESSVQERLQQLQEVLRDGDCSQLRIVLKS